MKLKIFGNPPTDEQQAAFVAKTNKLIPALALLALVLALAPVLVPFLGSGHEQSDLYKQAAGASRALFLTGMGLCAIVACISLFRSAATREAPAEPAQPAHSE